jgi:hypothetical protein
VGRLITVIVVAALMAACQTTVAPVAVPSPSPSPTPHATATAAILQSGDAAPGLNVCLGSGPIDVYLATIAQSDSVLAARASNQWAQLRLLGAQDGAISLFTSNASACNAELGATTSVKAMVSLVARFADSGQADRAWESGVFGFTPPPPAEIVPGLTRGAGTGLGLSSFSYERPSVRLACWHRSVFVALVVVSNLDLNTFKAATAAVDARLN